ncbi:MAG TPA: transglutaminase family protein, partial [Oceanipulchritudo sp.]|nr:transglutaminase family protein [Oceanipulchritudo sp.]
LKEQDVRLTMGGEPTFISIDDPDGPEWNTVAVGPEKRMLSEDLLRRMWKQFAPGGVLHHGQGKWYPGESLPRWAFACYWRKDGEPIWKNEALLGKLTDEPGYTFEDARVFAAKLSEALGVQSDFIMPAYEDVAYYLWKEHRLPANVDPTDNRLEDPEERTRMAKIFDRGLNHPRGWVMPLKYQLWQSRWKSIKWKVRSQALMLIPGDSPMGLRLPLNSLTWDEGAEPDLFIPLDPTTIPIEEPLPDRRQTHLRMAPDDGAAALNPELRPQRQSLEGEEQGKSNLPSWIVRTALCVEERDGRIYVFVPPLESAEAYLDLIAAIEHTAEATQFKVIIEGEKAPYDPRINSFEITPDPGVIEVNIHPSESWPELVERTLTLYHEARQSRLGTEKFMLDGRHTGTGGGNHFVFGGKSPQDSPFLRRPDLLASMVAYWHHHPCLSYLFASLFIGPTSQSPRIDEARNDALYELEIALQEIQDSKGDCPPWLVDRIFRHLLTDITGNTHRAEFCIDKLYNPDRSTGRLGLLELRSFEMPPHERMSLSQQLLVRGLISMLWKKPYQPKRLIRWGTQLHDRFLLPDFVWQDLLDVIADLQADGQPFDPVWFEAHYEFRFPWYGKIQYRDTVMELRQALEPWHVLGEEGSAGSTVRFVDSSVERLQVKLTGFIPERFSVLCNGRPLPLVPTGRAGEYICAVRFRAWQPASCLHPTLKPDVPLVFDLVDEWSQTVVAGCTYHVGHPGGRNYEQFPINSNEAEGRRLARFTPFGHSPGAVPRYVPAEQSLEFPYTLDLRR